MCVSGSPICNSLVPASLTSLEFAARSVIIIIFVVKQRDALYAISPRLGELQGFRQSGRARRADCADR